MNGDAIRQSFLFLLGLIYIGVGFFIFWRKIIDAPWNEILAILFIAYGSWRFYRGLTNK